LGIYYKVNRVSSKLADRVYGLDISINLSNNSKSRKNRKGKILMSNTYDEYRIAVCTAKILKYAGFDIFSEDKALKLIYEWVKSGHITFKEFKALTTFVYNEANKNDR
jgi:hypothetical protein